MSTFQFKAKKRRVKRDQAAKPIPENLKDDPGGPPWIVQNQSATSIEWNVSKALDKLGLSYQFQFFMFGGRQRAGGSVIDFKVYTPGKPTLLNVNGRYWHTGIHNDELQAARIRQLSAGKYTFLEIWEEQCLTIDSAVSWLRNNLYM